LQPYTGFEENPIIEVCPSDNRFSDIDVNLNLRVNFDRCRALDKTLEQFRGRFYAIIHTYAASNRKIN
jgi:hypothetical protein